MALFNTLGPDKTHKMAHNAPRIDKIRKPLLVPPALFEFAARSLLIRLSLLILLFLTFSLILLKLDIRSKALFTKGVSQADAGVVGIDSTNVHKAEENQPVAPPSSPLL